MEGAALAATRKHEADISLAWHTAAFNAATKSKKGLPKLGTILKRPVRQQSSEEMLAVLQELKARGAPMNIRRVN